MAAFSTIAGIGLGVAGIGASVSGARRGAEAVENAGERSDATQRYIYDDIKERSAYREGIGNQAIGTLAGLYGLGGPQQGPQGFVGALGGGQGGGFSAGLASGAFGGGNGDFARSGYNINPALTRGVTNGPQGGGFNAQSYLQANPDVLQAYQSNNLGIGSPGEFAQLHYQTHGRGEGRQGAFAQTPQQPATAANGQGGANVPNMPQTTPQGGATSKFADFYASPDYQLAFTEGQDAIEGSAAARGGLLSGNTAKAVTAFGQDLATSTFGNYRGALQNLAGTGQQATNTINQAGQNYANNFSNNAFAVGNANAQAAGSIGNTIGGAAGFGLGILGQQNNWWGAQ